MIELKTEIEKFIKLTNGRISYSGYSDCPTIKETGSNYLLEVFPEWKYQSNFLTGVYNLLKYFNNIDELKQHCKNIENKFKFDPTYYVEGEKYYARNVKGNSVWDSCIIDIQPADKVDNSWVALSNLKKYLMDRPNLVCWNTIINNVDKETTEK